MTRVGSQRHGGKKKSTFINPLSQLGSNAKTHNFLKAYVKEKTISVIN